MHARRQGISLMEVLFSIGIVTIGLLGVITLLPLASRYVGKGNTADGMSALGRNARQELYARGMTDPGNWFVDNAQPGGTPALGATYFPLAVCIDPRFVATNRLDIQAMPVSPAVNNLAKFPHVQADINGGPAGNYPYLIPAACSQLPPRAHGPSLAAQQRPSVGRSDAALASRQHLYRRQRTGVLAPDDRTLPPFQRYDTDLAGVAVERQQQGSLSWMATLTPRIEQSGLTRLYTLSIVVLENRPRAPRIWNDGADDYTFSGPDTSNETVLSVTLGVAPIVNGPSPPTPPTSLVRMSPGGGPVLVTTTTGSEGDIKIRQNDWLMLSSFLRTEPLAPTVKIPVFNWYRVIRAQVDADALSVPGQFQKNLTLEGPDFVFSDGELVQATFMPGVVGVYEKNVFLELSTNWQPTR